MPEAGVIGKLLAPSGVNRPDESADALDCELIQEQRRMALAGDRHGLRVWVAGEHFLEDGR